MLLTCWTYGLLLDEYCKKILLNWSWPAIRNIHFCLYFTVKEASSALAFTNQNYQTVIPIFKSKLYSTGHGCLMILEGKNVTLRLHDVYHRSDNLALHMQ